jgi:hypothetical protein
MATTETLWPSFSVYLPTVSLIATLIEAGRTIALKPVTSPPLDSYHGFPATCDEFAGR